MDFNDKSNSGHDSEYIEVYCAELGGFCDTTICISCPYRNYDDFLR